MLSVSPVWSRETWWPLWRLASPHSKCVCLWLLIPANSWLICVICCSPQCEAGWPGDHPGGWPRHSKNPLRRLEPFLNIHPRWSRGRLFLPFAVSFGTMIDSAVGPSTGYRYIVFGSGSWNLSQFRFGSGPPIWTRIQAFSQRSFLNTVPYQREKMWKIFVSN